MATQQPPLSVSVYAPMWPGGSAALSPPVSAILAPWPHTPHHAGAEQDRTALPVCHPLPAAKSPRTGPSGRCACSGPSTADTCPAGLPPISGASSSRPVVTGWAARD